MDRGRRRGREAGGSVLLVAMIVAGLGLGALGLVRLTADDPEVSRLEGELETVEDDAATATDETETARSDEAAIRAAAIDLDDQLIALQEAIESSVDAQQALVDDFNAILESDPASPAAALELLDGLQGAIDTTKTAEADALTAYSAANDAQRALTDALENGGD